MSDPDAGAGADARRRPLVDPASVAIVVLAAALPFALFLASNATKVLAPSRIVVVALVWCGLNVLALVAVRTARRSPSPVPAALGVAVANLSFWFFDRWLTFEPGSTASLLGGLLIWLAVTLLLVRLVTKLASVSWVPGFALAFLAIWTATSVLGFAVGRASGTGGDQPELAAGDPTPFVERPNVYWFVLDEHARADQVASLTGLDSNWFSADLRDRGFSVSTSTWSAYPHTHLSIASTLAMAYPFTPGHDYRSDYLLTTPIIQGENPVVATFEANGYQAVWAPPGSVEWTTCPPASPTRECIEPIGGALSLREPYSNLVAATPVGLVDLPRTYNDLGSVMDGVRSLDPADGPRFVFAHVLSPHDPHRYRDDCTYRDPWETGRNLTGPERAAAYANDVDCLDHAMIDTIDEIIATDPDAVIIVQSDHGSKLSFSWDTPYEGWSDAQLTERFGAVDAMRLPGSCRGTSIEGQSLVNTFPILFACLRGTAPELIEARSFFTSFDRIDTLVEVPAERLHAPEVEP